MWRERMTAGRVSWAWTRSRLAVSQMARSPLSGRLMASDSPRRGESFRTGLVVALVLAGILHLPGCTEATSPEAEPVEEARKPTLHADGSTLVDLRDCETFFARGDSDPATFTQSGNVIACSGAAKGYFYTTASFENFVLRGEFRFVPPPEGVPADESEQLLFNTGFLIYVTGEHKQWPKCLEVQGRRDTIAVIKANGGAASPTITDDEQKRVEARKTIGEWNSIEIVSTDGALRATLNGIEVCSSEATDLTAGQIGFQSEGYAVEFRDLRIAER